MSEWPCACAPRCDNLAVHTEYSPYMDDYCDDCTWMRCDVSFDVHSEDGKGATNEA